MNYSKIRKMDISNGVGMGVSLFVSGCPLHCKGCFNSVAWDYEAGNLFTDGVEEFFLSLASSPHVQRISILGGEPLADHNFPTVLPLVRHIRNRFGNSKKIWVYSGYTFEEIDETYKSAIFSFIDVLVDGRYIDEEKDMNLKFRGSRNQRVIDVPRTLKKDKIVELSMD